VPGFATPSDVLWITLLGCRDTHDQQRLRPSCELIFASPVLLGRDPRTLEEILTVQEYQQIARRPTGPEVAPDKKPSTINTRTTRRLPLCVLFQNPEIDIRVEQDTRHFFEVFGSKGKTPYRKYGKT
jgi:hypothetical protein